MTTNFIRPNSKPDIQVELSFFPTDQGGPRNTIHSGARIPHDFGLSNELNDGMYDFVESKSLAPGKTGLADVWLLDPERNYGRLKPRFKFRVWDGRWIGSGIVIKILNEKLKEKIAEHVPPVHPRSGEH